MKQAKNRAENDGTPPRWGWALVQKVVPSSSGCQKWEKWPYIRAFSPFSTPKRGTTTVDYRGLGSKCDPYSAIFSRMLVTKIFYRMPLRRPQTRQFFWSTRDIECPPYDLVHIYAQARAEYLIIRDLHFVWLDTYTSSIEYLKNVWPLESANFVPFWRFTAIGIILRCIKTVFFQNSS